MQRSCPYCGRVVPYDHKCDMAPARKWKQKDNKITRFHHSRAWTDKSRDIRARDNGIDQAAIHGLDGEPYIYTHELSVHHIIPLSEDFDRRLDDYNLITLSKKTHELAEKGLIRREDLLAIAKRNTDAMRR